MSEDDLDFSKESSEINKDVFKNIQISSQEHMLIISLEKFYEKNNNINKILPIVRGSSNISMRLIDYFVTNYSKKYRVSYNLRENDSNIIFNVYTSYKSQLKAYNKKYFDPFSRGDRIPFFFENDCLITTIGQLNFFRWFVSKKIINYVIDHLEEIELDLNNSKSNIKRKKKKLNKTRSLSRKPVKYNQINYVNKMNLDGPKKPMKIEVTFE